MTIYETVFEVAIQSRSQISRVGAICENFAMANL